jgi:hypothetical protein
MKFELVKRLVEAQDKKNAELDKKEGEQNSHAASGDKKIGKKVFDPADKQNKKQQPDSTGGKPKNAKLAQADLERNDDGSLKTDMPPNGKTFTGEPANKIDLDPKTTTPLGEGKAETAVVTFGRMNPPTIGHERLVDKICEIADAINGHPLVFLSRSQDKKKNPIPYLKKLQFARRAFGSIVQPTPSDASSIFGILKHLEGRYDSVILVVGSDRVAELKAKVKKYNGSEFHFTNIEVKSAGERDPDDDGVAGASASNLRKLANQGELDAFKLGLPEKLKGIAQQVYKAVRIEEGFEEPITMSNENLIESVDLALHRMEADYELSEAEFRSLYEKSEESGFPIDVVEACYKRGVNSWELTETILDHQQFAFNRVNAMLNGGSTLDDDLFEGFTGDIQVPLQVAQSDKTNKKAQHRTDVKPPKIKKVQTIRKIIEQISEDSVPGIKDGKGVRRIDMPQISDFDAFTKDLEANGTPMREPKGYKASSLTPLQKHFSQEKVDRMKGEKNRKPIIISSDKKIIDGHHRWVAAHQEGSDVQAREIGMKHDELLSFLKDKPYVAHRKLNEDVYSRAVHHKSVASLHPKNSKEYHTHMGSHHELIGEWHRANGRINAAERSFAKASLHQEAARAV